MRLKYLFFILFAFLVGSVSAKEDFKLFAEPVDGNIMAWSGYRRLFHSIYGSPNNLTFRFVVPNRNSKFIVHNSRLFVKVSSGVKVEEILPQYGLGSGRKTEFKLPFTLKSSRDQDVYEFQTDNFLNINRSAGGRPSQKEISFYFEPKKFDPQKEYLITYYFVNNKQKSPEKVVILKFLNPLKSAPLPRHFKFMNFVKLPHMNVKSPKLLKKIIRNYRIAGADSRMIELENTRNADIENVLRDSGWRFHIQAPWNLRTYSRRWVGKDAKIKPALLLDGKKSIDIHCPLAGLKNTQLRTAVINSTFKGRNIKNGDVLLVDIEPFGGYWTGACFCTECLDDFAYKFKIDRSKLTSPKLVRDTYGDAWLKYCLNIQTELIRVPIDYFHSKYPDSKIIIYDYIIDFDKPKKRDTFFKSCLLDPRLTDKFVDEHQPSLYYYNGRQVIEIIQRQIKNLKKKVGGTISLDRGIGYGSDFLTMDNTLTPPEARLKILAIAAAGGSSVTNYTGYYIDGKFFENIALAMQEIAVVEDYYRLGKPGVLKAILDPEWDRQHDDDYLIDKLGIVSQQLQGKDLVTMLNFGKSKKIRTRFNYTGLLSKFRVTDPVNRIRYTFNGSPIINKKDFNKYFSSMIKPLGAAWMLISESDPFKTENSVITRNIVKTQSKTNNPASSHSQLNQKIELEKKRLQECLRQTFPTRNLHSTSISCKDDLVVVKTPTQEVTISRDSGLIVYWKNLSSEKVILPEYRSSKYNFGAGMGWLTVFEPARLADSLRGAHQIYSPVEVSIQDEGAAIIRLGCLQREFYLSKTFSISGSATEITVKNGLTNLTLNSLKCSMWFRNCLPYPDAIFKSKDKLIKLKPNNNVFCSPVNVTEFTDAKKLRYFRGKLLTNSLTVKLPIGDLEFQWNSRDIGKLLIYRGKQVVTAELITFKKVVKPLKEHSFSYKILN